MNILIVTDAWDPQVNGVVRTLKSTRDELQKAGHAVDLLTPLEFTTVPCPTYPEIRLSILPGRRVARRIRASGAQALHIATEGPLGLAARAYALRHGVPFTTAYHTRFPEYVRARFGIPLSLTYRFLRWFHGSAESVLVPTRVVKQDLEAFGFAPERVVLWSRGVELDVFKPGPATPHDLTKPIFLYVGRIAIEKNIEAFLDLDLPGSKWVAGEGPQLARLRAAHPAVRFTGVLGQTELAALYNAADVFVFPSRTDTFGLVLLEALACGCPVAAYPVTGPIDVIGDSPAGALDEDLRAAALRALSIDRRVARAHAERYSWAACTRQFLASLHPIGAARKDALQGDDVARDAVATQVDAPSLADEAFDVESPYKSPGGPGRLLNALRYSMRGLALALRIESAFRQELFLAVVLVPCALALALPAVETLALVGSIVVVLIVELINSSIEAAVDRISLDPHRLSGRAKDLGSAAVFLALLLCLLTWTLIAGPVVLSRLRHVVP